MYNILLRTLQIVIFALCFQMELTANNIYGSINNIDYLLGQFNPSLNDKFISLKNAGIPSDGREHFIRIETAEALKKVFADFKKQYPKIKLWIASSTRTYLQQKIIWESKWSIESKNRTKKNTSIADSNEIHLKILKYSSMPGTSRHHWGTDIDFNVLENSYYNSGDGKIIYNWMKKNMSKYGFCQVYNKERNIGYQEERWHWSYMPLAKKFTEDLIKLFNANPKQFSNRIDFKGAEIKDILELAIIYVSSINPECK